MRACLSIVVFLVGVNAFLAEASSLIENETYISRKLLAAPPSNPQVANAITADINSGNLDAAAQDIAQALKQGDSG